MTQVVPILRVADVDASVTWWQRLGFVLDFVHRFEGVPQRFVGIKRDDVLVYLSEHAGDAYTPALVYLWVDNVDALAAEFGVPVSANPWARDFEVIDPDHNRVRVGSREFGQSG